MAAALVPLRVRVSSGFSPGEFRRALALRTGAVTLRTTMSPVAARRLRRLAVALGAVALLVLLAGGWVYWRLRGSLPQLEGEARVAGLGAAVTVERDALGVPTLRGSSRVDLARTLGWLHAQDRFFQMDLLRRAAAGELAELFGQRALPRDRATRVHGFRKLAQTAVPRLAPAEREILAAYAAGVNSGLGALRELPFEYLLLQLAPTPWRPEDCVLVGYAMMLDLQDGTGRHERTLMTLRDKHGADALAFFAPLLSANDAALDGTTAPLPPIPGPEWINLRAPKLGAARRPGSDFPVAHELVRDAESWRQNDQFASFPFPARDPDSIFGSNAFALAGAHTASGAGLLANDMHLGHAVPNIWYRASLEYGGQRVTGVTLPGTPVVVAGSNGHVAWGFTASYTDTGDIIILEAETGAASSYRASGHAELLTIEKRLESIVVKGGAPVTMTYDWTVWGPIVGRNDRHQPLAYRWMAYDPDAANFTLVELEAARTVDEATAIAHRAGVSPVNFIVADRAGDVAWTIAGQLPDRVGFDGRLPVSWSSGERTWVGHLAPDKVPVVHGSRSVAPGRIWSGNQRQVGGAALAKLGDGSYHHAPRAAQIRDDLVKLTRATPRDLLAVQLDDRALFLKPWHTLLMQALTPAATGGSATRAALRKHAESWEGRASIDAVSYRVVREFRQAVRQRVFDPLFAACVQTTPDFNWRRLDLEPALQAMLRERPLHLLAPNFTNWDELLIAAMDDTIALIEKSGQPLPRGTWGERNRANIRHPFTISFPILGRWLNLPADPLPGDNDMPRVQTPTNGASERLVVSPGREAEGIYHMPGGQSAHPLSPYFQAGHAAWVRGEPTPFLPGSAAHRLTLKP